ncbi:myotubularin-related protein 6 isoform X2 [Orussus abietinus]|uniref:myotubularin-related protein 6 isoform X2 n=1 Tax=Orussus abietinus TaxID=222816 RepID=UPI00062545ED|nr:myotubularin-related protein 6 isoform X2 [Orussus abietinus]
MVANVQMLDKYNSHHSKGTLFLLVTHLVFADSSEKKEIWVLHTHIASVEKLPLTTTGSPLLVKCKHFLVATFVIPKERDCHEIYLTLLKLSSPARTEDLYCFSYRPKKDTFPRHLGWNFFDIRSEFQRLGVPNEKWSLSYLNTNYELCDTYPRYLIVPSTCANNILKGSAKFRSRGRLPVLTYLHSNMAAICRCSQPLSGFNARCPEDEQMLYNILRTNLNSKYVYVVDTRPRINAMANRAAGKGYENENFYDNIKFHFFGIENIHVMRSSLNKLLELQRSTTMNGFLSGLESSGWLKHIRSILETAWFIANAVSNGITVVVHCSDGWDRTAQVCSLAAMMLDPFYRTIQGFQILIEKDWLAFGHKFSDRCGHISSDGKEISPIFTQFIDCTYQLLQQYPYAFQFNEHFLLTLHDHVHSCRYGTFIGNCEKDRQTLRLWERTYSLWGYVSTYTNEYLNPLYTCNRNKKNDIAILQPKLSPQSIRFWRAFYCRFDDGVQPRETSENFILSIYGHIISMEDHVKLLIKRVNEIGHPLVGNKTQMDFQDKYDRFDMKYNKNCLSEKIIENSANEEEMDNKMLKASQLDEEMKTIALEWKSSRDMEECVCSTPFSAFNKKYHCWSCGNVLCTRCMGPPCALRGHFTKRAVPVCKWCFRRFSGSSPTAS